MGTFCVKSENYGTASHGVGDIIQSSLQSKEGLVSRGWEPLAISQLD